MSALRRDEPHEALASTLPFTKSAICGTVLSRSAELADEAPYPFATIARRTNASRSTPRLAAPHGEAGRRCRCSGSILIGSSGIDAERQRFDEVGAPGPDVAKFCWSLALVRSSSS